MISQRYQSDYSRYLGATCTLRTENAINWPLRKYTKKLLL